MQAWAPGEDREKKAHRNWGDITVRWSGANLGQKKNKPPLQLQRKKE